MDNFCLPLVAPVSVVAAATVSSTPSVALWHARLGHASSSRVQQLASRGITSEWRNVLGIFCLQEFVVWFLWPLGGYGRVGGGGGGKRVVGGGGGGKRFVGGGDGGDGGVGGGGGGDGGGGGG
ncbi:glycine-rich protein 5-like [Quercus lobata]|uniref:glycine-rich protein 5-like n=1 Tax=Quercus lobata TaxID=97700 RepID=UPI00124593A3|nr:glycine-rich protein 5-like [Quercus lobata]